MAETTETPTGLPSMAECRELLVGVLQEMEVQGFARSAVDTWTHRGDGTSVRHHYSGGEWRLTVRRPGTTTRGYDPHQPEGPAVIHWGVRIPGLPNVSTVVEQITGVAATP